MPKIESGTQIYHENFFLKDPAETTVYPPKKQARNAVLILAFANILAFIDRQIPAMLIEPIKQDFGLSDSQIALLGGAAFSLFYALMAFPIGYAVDHVKRMRLLGAGIGLWSFMTVSAIFANSFTKLFGARIGVAVGEAVVAPTSVSLVGDYYPLNERGNPMAVITSGVYLGIGISLLGGGFLIDYLTRIGGVTLPMVGLIKPWQAVFLIAGVPGLFLAAVAFAMDEPQRIRVASSFGSQQADRAIIVHLKTHRASLIPMFSGFIFMSMIFYSFSFWGPTMMLRTFDLTLTEVGATLGIVTILCSIVGTFLAGFSVDWLSTKGYKDAPLRAAICACLSALPMIVLAPIMPSPLLSWCFIGLYLMFISAYATLSLLAVGRMAGANLRGQLTAVFALLMMLFGLTIGPQLTALITDFVFADVSALNWSMSVTGGLTLPIAAWLFKISLPHYRTAVEQLNS